MTKDRNSLHVCFDPRDPAQSLSDRSTWRPSDNAILISATVLLTARETHPIHWDRVAALADLCDQEPGLLVTRDETNALLRQILATGRQARRQ